MNNHDQLSLFFKDLKVLELAGVLAGPAVGMFFAELGAKVTKIENNKTGGDMTRTWKLPQEDKNSSTSAYFSSVNYHKEYLDLDLKDLKDREVFYALVAESDIVIANFKESSAQKLGVDYQQLSALNPALIYASIEGFSSDPRKVAFDLVLQAETGFMGMNGYPDQLPAKLPVALIDILAAHQLKEGILMALLKKERSGKGSNVRVSLEAAALSSLANQASNYLMEGHIPQRLGSLHPNIAPYGELFETRDKQLVVLAIGTNKQFNSLCDLLQANDLKEDPRFKTNTERVKNRVLLKATLDPLISGLRTREFLDSCLEKAIPVGEVKAMDQVMNNPIAKKMLLSEEIDGNATKRIKTVAFHMD
jgi:crotonobetainyl-CoA:carnitine CoA-transferase CaiB-like acyl-CoA transferase